MRKHPATRCTPVTSDVEIVTVRAHDGGFITTIHNGALDGEVFTAATFLGSLLQHKHAEGLAKIADQAERQSS